MYEDETHILDYQTLRATWSVKGKGEQIPTYGHHGSVSLFVLVNIQNGEFLCTEAEKCIAQTFLGFLRQILPMDEEHNQSILKKID